MTLCVIIKGHHFILNIRLDFCYNGSFYHGSQKQLEEKTVQSVLEEKLCLFLKEKVNLIFAGRTDRGVHANGQVANFKIKELIIPIEKLARVINNSLHAEEIYIHKCSIVEEDFNSRFDARVRLYCYQIKNFEKDNHFNIADKNFFYHYRDSLEINKLLFYFNCFLGEHDFTTFCSKKDESKNKKRTIFKIDIFNEKDIIKIYIYGNAFLRSMIRSLVGNVLYLYKNQKPPEKITELLVKKNPDLAKHRVPAHGLFLQSVFYSEVFGKREKS